MKGESVHKMCTSKPSSTPLGVEATDGGSMPPPYGDVILFGDDVRVGSGV
jgi:hypothetical protein